MPTSEIREGQSSCSLKTQFFWAWSVLSSGLQWLCPHELAMFHSQRKTRMAGPAHFLIYPTFLPQFWLPRCQEFDPFKLSSLIIELSLRIKQRTSYNLKRKNREAFLPLLQEASQVGTLWTPNDTLWPSIHCTVASITWRWGADSPGKTFPLHHWAGHQMSKTWWLECDCVWNARVHWAWLQLGKGQRLSQIHLRGDTAAHPARDSPLDKSSDAAWWVEVWTRRAGYRGI